jgi:hypothetical protein
MIGEQRTKEAAPSKEAAFIQAILAFYFFFLFFAHLAYKFLFPLSFLEIFVTLLLGPLLEYQPLKV